MADVMSLSTWTHSLGHQFNFKQFIGGCTSHYQIGLRGCSWVHSTDISRAHVSWQIRYIFRLCSYWFEWPLNINFSGSCVVTKENDMLLQLNCHWPSQIFYYWLKCNSQSCLQNKIILFCGSSDWQFLAATKQLFEWFSLSVRPSVCHTFLTMFPSWYNHKIFRNYYQWQKWRPCKKSRSEVKGEGHSGKKNRQIWPRLGVSGL